MYISAYLSRSGVDGIDVDYGHLFVQNLGARLNQLASLAIQAGSLQEQT